MIVVADVPIGVCGVWGVGGGWCFFFQAEDGIRDYKVTGVQTCALPICIKSGALPQREMGSIKSGGAAAARIGKYKKWGRCRTENWSV